MSVMRFIPKLTRYLRQYGLIYTVRAYHYSTSEATVSGIGLCRRELIAQLCDEELSTLQAYVAESGFDSLGAWVYKIRYFIPPGKPMYLYKVEVLR